MSGLYYHSLKGGVSVEHHKVLTTAEILGSLAFGFGVFLGRLSVSWW